MRSFRSTDSEELFRRAEGLESAGSRRFSLHDAEVSVTDAVPSDRAFRSDYRDAVGHAVVDLLSWCRRQTGGLTFSIYDTTPEQCQMSEPSEYFDEDP